MIREIVGSANVDLIKHLQRDQRGNTLSFEVKSYKPDGYPSEESSKIKMTIDSRWHRILWANTLIFFAFVGLIYGYLRYRFNQIRKEEAFKRKEAEFRQKEAEYKQLVAETETALLRLQMNPHFIFNCMNSINSYILQKEVDTACDYLHHFARLMRMILNFSEKPFISVSDEIELLELYLQTEAMRFNGKFTFSFELKNGLDPDEYVIPTMILQPLVENAIQHGLSNKKEGKGHIRISLWKENESLLCSVEDNGIGRAASCQISQKTKMHESKALAIIEHRLQLLEKKKGVSASFEIIDLVDASRKIAGTKVLLRFPLY
jgi:LytS/YehU family sensor histidine kinase